MESSTDHRKGILSAGNWLVDFVKIIDRYPEPTMLASILSESVGLGGAPNNVLATLAVLDPALPLYAGGMIGTDANGDRIVAEIDRLGINRRFLYRSEHLSTSYTDVMTEKATGRRTFFHCRGANAALAPEHFSDIDVPARIFHLGYLLLLDTLDQPDPVYGVVAAGVLKGLSEKGYRISVDCVSEESDRYQSVVIPCLPYMNYLIVNEMEAGRITGINLRNKNGEIIPERLPEAASVLFAGGVKEAIAIHFPEGGYAMRRDGTGAYCKAFVMKQDQIKGTVGAGDAFCAGMLYALHESWTLEEGLRLANAVAAVSLTHPTSTGGARSLAKVLRFANGG